MSCLKMAPASLRGETILRGYCGLFIYLLFSFFLHSYIMLFSIGVLYLISLFIPLPSLYYTFLYWGICLLCVILFYSIEGLFYCLLFLLLFFTSADV